LRFIALNGSTAAIALGGKISNASGWSVARQLQFAGTSTSNTSTSNSLSQCASIDFYISTVMLPSQDPVRESPIDQSSNLKIDALIQHPIK